MLRFYTLVIFLLLHSVAFATEKYRVVGQLKKGSQIVVFEKTISERTLEIVFPKNVKRGKLMAAAQILSNSTVEALGTIHQQSLEIESLKKGVPDPLHAGNGSGMWKVK